MYLDYWNLTEEPFKNVPDRNVFFKSNPHEEALMRLLYAVEHRKGAAMLTGEVGSGKTTVSQVLINHLAKDRFAITTIVNPDVNSVDFIRAILLAMQEKADEDSKTILLERLMKRLSKNFKNNLITVLIIDEAHLIKDSSSFEELRMLLNLQSNNQFLVTLIMIGQSPLKEKIANHKPLKERIGIKYDLSPMDLQDTIRYILFRLEKAGAERGIFSKEAVQLIYNYAKGIPLRINNVSERSLLIGMMHKVRIIDKRIVNFAIEDLK